MISNATKIGLRKNLKTLENLREDVKQKTGQREVSKLMAQIFSIF